MSTKVLSICCLHLQIDMHAAQAKLALVAAYMKLRAGDQVGGAVYRITVRQLEALVRLSEAHARVRCSPVIEPGDVREVSCVVLFGKSFLLCSGKCTDSASANALCPLGPFCVATQAGRRASSCTAPARYSTLDAIYSVLQAKRLVKSSIIAVETTEQEVDDDDFFQDNAEVTDFVNAHRGSEMPPAADGAPQGEAACPSCRLWQACLTVTGLELHSCIYTYQHHLHKSVLSSRLDCK